MKKLFLIFLPIIMMSCKSDTYYAALNTNHQRFDGWQAENAEFLMETNDQVLLLENLTALAIDEAKLRETYLMSEDAHSEFKNLAIDIQIQAAAKRIKLASVLSNDRDGLYHQVKETDQDRFDAYYLEILSQTLTNLESDAREYIKTGHNDGLRNFAYKIISSIKPVQDALNPESNS